jgi:tubulin-like protein
MRAKGIKTPALVVALGTTASKATHELCEHLLSMEQDDRDAVAVVTIDTDTARPDFRNLLESNPGKFHAFHAPIRVPPNVDHADHLPRAMRRQVFMPRYTPRYFDYGAGGIRNHGHVALAYRLDEVYGALRNALAAIELLPTGQGHRITDSVQVYVVTFLGGGTGSGIMSDIGIILRDMLATELKGQRLILFGILPGDHMPGAGAREESWRKSNSAAAMFEMIGTSLAAQGAPDGVYRKRLLGRQFEIHEGPLFNEVYLVGRTNLDDVDKIAHMVGLDLFQRITDASGVGDRERSQSPDFHELKIPDGQGIFTNFSTSCPVEVRFPAREVADAFAHLAAGRLLQIERFVGEIPAEYADKEEDRDRWEEKWDTYARPAPDDAPSGSTSADVRKLPSFSANQFIGVGPLRRNTLWKQVEDAIARMPAELARARRAILQLETDRFDSIPEEGPEGSQSSFTGRRLNHLSKLRAEYRYALQLFTDYPQDHPDADRNHALESRLDSGYGPMGLLGFVTPVRDNMEQARAQEVAQFYNQYVERVFLYRRHEMLMDVVQELKRRADDLYEGGKRDVIDARPQEMAEKFIKRGLSSQIWQGKLGKEHPHQIGLFEIERFQRTKDARDLPALPAMVGLFRWATSANDEGTLGDCTSLNIKDSDADLLSERWMGDCFRYLNKARRQDATALEGAHLTDADLHDALAVDAGRLSERVLEFFRERYWKIFADENLFDLLAIGYAAESGRSRGFAWREVPNLMREHLEHASNILRAMIKSDSSLWLDKAERPTLYLGVNWRDDTPEKGWIESLARSVRFEKWDLDGPKIDRDSDPHRMQLNLALHAISIRAIPMFFMRHNSLTSEYLRHESAWLSGWQPPAPAEQGAASQRGAAAQFGAAAPQSGSGPYGSGPYGAAQQGGATQPGGGGRQPGASQSVYGSRGVPVHSCEEAEWLTLDGNAYRLPGQRREYPNAGPSLVQRILRATPRAPQEPDWSVQDRGDDDLYGRPVDFDGEDVGGNGGYGGHNGGNGGYGGRHGLG